ncbi:hypothetical protein OEB99_11365 [Actinotalea sp. M2MS4P-6]|uniref:hypothetical protein n=1 Tax=Actinotalea sp. M2MS4P-6 TaxID=2983762 RepID=UPI0021E3F80A|nr:hypothetical protein [Actinotalea sp. M2MS4P-6]MCV2394909.1 hypothetical protein [Actinotalea sp. M2MS4P-6]
MTDREPSEASRRATWLVWAVVAAVFVGLGILALVTGRFSPSDAGTSEPSATVTAPGTTESATEPATTEPATERPTATETATAEPTASPTAPDFGACGEELDVTSDPGLWVGDYGGGTDAESDTPVDLRWSLIAVEDWSDRAVAVAVLGLWLTREDETTVAAVPSEVPVAPGTVEFTPGSEGGGGGSEGVLELSVPFTACPGGLDPIPVGVYQARVHLLVDDGTTEHDTWGYEFVFVGGYDAATAAAG